MAIKRETFFKDGTEFTRTYSDAGRYVVRDGIEFEEACDPSEFGRTYIEGDPIEDTSEDADKAEAYDILIGGAQ